MGIPWLLSVGCGWTPVLSEAKGSGVGGLVAGLCDAVVVVGVTDRQRKAAVGPRGS